MIQLEVRRTKTARKGEEMVWWKEERSLDSDIETNHLSTHVMVSSSDPTDGWRPAAEDYGLR
jgi:hypothetical protein